MSELLPERLRQFLEAGASPPWFVIVVIFPVLWLATLGLISRFGGWQPLATRYPQRTPPVGSHFSFQSLKLGFFSNYNNCINITVGQSGVWLAPLFLFQIFHAPIEIRWEDLKAVSEQRLFFVAVVELRTTEDRAFTVFGAAGRQIMSVWNARSQ